MEKKTRISDDWNFVEFEAQTEEFKDRYDIDPNHADEIVDLLSRKKMTYEQAYATLRLAYDQLKHQTKYLHL
ncbi:hypothetical protein [Enterococcus mundtii]|uniref:hypothetical protein n=1 Tax=Enterococcus mundtii TaxID=53346 RepID=UPI002DB57443|nr:hypothetical protein [Enterococcus mundtii]MEC3942414.1 hypothetical protein [Enterococcus mundtii]